jgi:hypothetical protein
VIASTIVTVSLTMGKKSSPCVDVGVSKIIRKEIIKK